MRKAAPFKDEVNPVDLRADKDGFRIVIRNDNPGLAEQMMKLIGWIDSLQDEFRRLGVVLDEGLLGTVHEFKADLKRGTAAANFRRTDVGFNCDHISC